MTRKRWGGKSAWAKSFFALEGLSGKLVAGGGTPSGTRVDTKKRKRLERDPTTRWRCRRCGKCFELPVNAATNRVTYALLVEHLEGRSVSGAGTTTTGVDPCGAGQLRYTGSSDEVEGIHGDNANNLHASARSDEDEASFPCTVNDRRCDIPTNSSRHEESSERAAVIALTKLLLSFSPDTDWTLGSATLNTATRVFVVVDNPKTPANYGSILRSMDCYRLTNGGFLFSGTRLENALRHSPVPTDTQGASDRVAQVGMPTLDTLFTVLEEIKRTRGDVVVTVVAVDLIENATPLPLYEHPHCLPPSSRGATTVSPIRPHLVFYVFGPEDGSLSQGHLKHCDEAVLIPTMGSLNLATSVATVLYDRIAKDCVTVYNARASGLGAEAGDKWPDVCAHRNPSNRLNWAEVAASKRLK